MVISELFFLCLGIWLEQWMFFFKCRSYQKYKKLTKGSKFNEKLFFIWKYQNNAVHYGNGSMIMVTQSRPSIQSEHYHNTLSIKRDREKKTKACIWHKWQGGTYSHRPTNWTCRTKETVWSSRHPRWDILAPLLYTFSI